MKSLDLLIGHATFPGHDLIYHFCHVALLAVVGSRVATAEDNLDETEVVGNANDNLLLLTYHHLYPAQLRHT